MQGSIPARSTNPVLAAEPASSQDAGHEASHSAAHELMRRAPMAYVWNQLSSFWLFFSSFLLTLVIARGLGRTDYGVFAVALTFYNTAVYVAAFGLEDAATVFVPRTLALQGQAATGSVVRRLLITRTLCVMLVGAGIAWGIFAVASVLSLHLPRGVSSQVPLPPHLDVLALPIAAYVVSTGLMNLLGATLTAMLRTRLTLAVGGLAQVANVAGAVAIIRLGGGVPGALWMLAAVAGTATAVYVFVLWPYLSRRRLEWHDLAAETRDTPAASVGELAGTQPVGRESPPFRPVLRLGATAWLTNLITGALLKQSAIALLQIFAVSIVAIGYFNLAFQLSHAAAYLFVAGLGGVGLAVMAAAYAGAQLAGLGTAWRIVSKMQMLLAVPLLAFCTLRASQIAVILYGPNYAAVGPLLAIFLIFTLAQMLTGSGVHQAALYVLGRQQLAFGAQAGALALTVLLGIVLIPRPAPIGGAAGALIAIGIGQLGAQVFQLALASRLIGRPYPLRCALRLSVALVPALALIGLWQHPITLAFSRKVLAGLPAPMSAQVPLAPATALTNLLDVTLAGVGFLLVLLICLAITKPLDAEDKAMLAAFSPRLARLLSPFVGADKTAGAV